MSNLFGGIFWDGGSILNWFIIDKKYEYNLNKEKQNNNIK